jgi:hypothetical protein
MTLDRNKRPRQGVTTFPRRAIILRSGGVAFLTLARGPEDHEANGTDCETDPNGSAIFRNPDVCFRFLFHMSPSEWDTRTDNHALEVLLSSVRTDQPEISVLLVSLALAMPQSHDSSMNDLALRSGALFKNSEIGSVSRAHVRVGSK